MRGFEVKKIDKATNHEALPGQVVVTESSEDRLGEMVLPELAPRTGTDRALAITLAADTQKDHFYYSVWAHALEPTEDWVIDAGVVGGFEELEELIFRSYFRREGSEERLPVWRAAIDTGGGEGFLWQESRTTRSISDC
ncbi:hypothetical protein AKJ60_00295 [candidate division MSBL1 archaeon SCGC-AAA385M11]|nr:hypothetical protein AKJ60_00295 [candidate division MSBL1 archaeon SCGC-AAA385M11]